MPEADSTMNEALQIATANQYTAYGRQLIGQKRVDKAMEVLLASQKDMVICLELIMAS